MQDTIDETGIHGPSVTSDVDVSQAHTVITLADGEKEISDGMSLTHSRNDVSRAVDSVNDEIKAVNEKAAQQHLGQVAPVNEDPQALDAKLGDIAKNVEGKQREVANLQGTVELAAISGAMGNGGATLLSGAVGMPSLGAKMRGGKGSGALSETQAEQEDMSFIKQEAALDRYEQKGDRIHSGHKPNDPEALFAKHGVSGGHNLNEAQLFTADVNHGLPAHVGVQRQQQSLGM